MSTMNFEANPLQQCIARVMEVSGGQGIAAMFAALCRDLAEFRAYMQTYTRTYMYASCSQLEFRGMFLMFGA
jgi:hypothetical protein